MPTSGPQGPLVLRLWCSGNPSACHAEDPSSILGRRSRWGYSFCWDEASGLQPEVREFDSLYLHFSLFATIVCMKICYKCKQAKSLDEFHKNKTKPDGLSNKCRACMKSYQKEHYRRNADRIKDRNRSYKASIRSWMRDLKSSLVCQRCGADHPAVLDFHHVDGKEFSISEAVCLGFSIETIKQEIDKCEVLCSNCHRIEHWDNTPRSSTG